MLWDLKASCGKGTKHNNTENLASSASTQVFIPELDYTELPTV